MKKIGLAITILAVAFLVGCAGGDDTSQGSTFIGGTQGVEISFVQDAPPATIVDNGQQTFPVMVRLENEGEDSVQPEEALVELYGFSPRSFGLTLADLEQQPPQELPANQKNPANGEIIVSPVVDTVFDGFSYQDSAVGTRQISFNANLCYNYETTVAAELCIKRNLNVEDEDDICQLNANRVISNSGSPIHVTKLTQSRAGNDKLRFSMTVDNVGDGDVFTPQSTCEESYTAENRLLMRVNGLEDATDITCSGFVEQVGPGEGYLRFPQNSDGTYQPTRVFCTITVPEDARNERLEPFTVTMQYDYTDTTSKTVTVQNTLG